MKIAISLVVLLTMTFMVSGQQVGINSINPEYTLDVRANSSEDAAQLNVSNQDKSNYLRIYSGSSIFPDPSISIAPERSLLFASFDDATSIFTEYMRISSNGNVGIGTIATVHKLDVNGNVKVAGIISGVANPVSAQDAATKAYVDSISGQTYAIGLSAEQGGYIFWVSLDGKHGLVAETIDQGVGTWFVAQNLISMPSNHSADGDNFRDWRLPTKYELNEMYLQKDDIGGFGENIFWSSTKDDNFYTWRQWFFNGLQGSSDNFSSYNVRAVRDF